MKSAPKKRNCPSAEKLQKLLPAYDQIEFHAIGGVGTVYKARHISLDRTVAIKLLTDSRAFSPQFRHIFQQEAQVMVKLNHENLVSIYDYGETKGLLYIVMQFFEGRSLHEIAHGKTVSPRESATLIAKICTALATAHQSGILHRDIKPANILINSKIKPIIIDFGLAHHCHESTAKGKSVYGTLGYTAPEVLKPPYQADLRADVFSLGVLLHELLTGQLPKDPFIPPSQLSTADSRFDSVVMRALHPNLNIRYPSASSLATDLHKILTDKELVSSPLQIPPSINPNY